MDTISQTSEQQSDTITGSHQAPAALLPFAQLCDQLTATTKKLEKRTLIAAYLATLILEDAARAALYLSGAPFAETDPRKLLLGGSTLAKAVQQLSGASQAAMHEAYRRHGDLGDAAYDVLAARSSQPAPTLTLAKLESAFTALALARGPSAKLPLLLALLSQATPLEARYILKLAGGDMRTGVKQSLVEEAVAAAYAAEPTSVRRAVMLNGSLAEVVAMAVSGTLAQARMRLFHPLGFMLASPVDSVDEALARFAEEVELEAAASSEHSQAHTADSPAEDGTPAISADSGAAVSLIVSAPALPAQLRAAQLEDKYDGMRAQLHCGDPARPTRVGLFSRNREDLSESFPELTEAFSHFGEEVILDGEILAWRPARATRHPERTREPAVDLTPADDAARALPFSSLQQRLGRKRVTTEMRQATPVVFMAFDLLYHGGGLLLDHPLAQRRARLEALLHTHAEQTDGRHHATVHPAQTTLFAPPPSALGFSRLMLAPAIQLEDAAQLDAAYTAARTRGNEGVMLKASASTYQPGRRGLAWLKLKRELATLDVVITAAEFGHGRRARLLSDYTFAVRNPVPAPGQPELLNVGKAYSGLTDPEVEALSERLKNLTLEEQGSYRTVEPVILLEVAFNNVMRSTRHASGFALRFPRILRIRFDKPLSEIDTLARVEEIYASQPDKPVED